MTRVALVTGAARGIGAACVARLDAEGYAIVAVDRAADDPRLPYAMGTGEQLDAVVAGAREAVAVRADTADADAMAGAVAIARERFGGLDAVLACAGVIAGGVPAWEVPIEQERAVLETDLIGVMTTARVTIPALLQRPQPRTGRFVAIASAAATRGLPMLAAYCAAKAGVAGLVHALAAELRGTGVTANAVAPGSTDTPILAESARLYDLPGAESFAAQQPIERLLAPDEVAAMLVWLAGAHAGGVTGALIPVDGGLAV
jgi:SDR family mycofactocin-dependent oxidoreductase